MLNEDTQEITQKNPPGGGPMEAAVRRAEERQQTAKIKQARETQEAAKVRATRIKGKEGVKQIVNTFIQSKEATQELRRSGVKPSGKTSRDYLSSLTKPSTVTQAIEGLKEK